MKDLVEDGAATRPSPRAGAVAESSLKRYARKAVSVGKEEVGAFHPRYVIARLLLSLLPDFVGGRLRAPILRAAGLRIGKGAIFCGTPALDGDKHMYQNLKIGPYCIMQVGIFLNVYAPVTIARGAYIGHETMILTYTHELGPRNRRCGDPRILPVHIGEGVWIGARATILPGVTIGDGAVVAAGAVVANDVPPDSLVGGVPARIIRHLKENGSDSAQN